MIRLIIISGFAFAIGNVIWPLFNEPKLFYIPLAVFITCLISEVKKYAKTELIHLFLKYLLVLSYGNIIKQVFYTERIAQINDYVWGGLVTVWLLYNLKKHYVWVIPKIRLGGRK